jgi:ribonuclease P/MRP protein subunit RPP1
MYHWGLVDAGHEVNNDAILSSRPDTLLANGGAFLPSPASAGYMLPPLAAQQPLSPASYGMAAATSPFRRAMSTGDLLVRDRDRDREEEQQVMAAPAPGRYSAEERRERIDKYRSKRNQRNFQKKITVCFAFAICCSRLL